MNSLIVNWLNYVRETLVPLQDHTLLAIENLLEKVKSLDLSDLSEILPCLSVENTQLIVSLTIFSLLVTYLKRLATEAPVKKAFTIFLFSAALYCCFERV